MAGLATLTTIFVSLLPGRLTTAAAQIDPSPAGSAASLAGYPVPIRWALTIGEFTGNLGAQ
jgi:hypothetical protein